MTGQLACLIAAGSWISKQLRLMHRRAKAAGVRLYVETSDGEVSYGDTSDEEEESDFDAEVDTDYDKVSDISEDDDDGSDREADAEEDHMSK